MKKKKNGEYVSPMMDSFCFGCEGVLCASTVGTNLESYSGLGDNQQDIF